MVAHPNPPGGVPRLRAVPRRQPHLRLHATLPAQPTPLVGRETDVAAVRARLLDPAVRLLTLTGPPGTGKTRLAVAVAEAVAAAFEDGVWFVGIETVREPDDVVATIAQSLGVREAAGQPLAEALSAYLANKQLLLVLDNFEQVLPAGAQVAEFLAACPGLTVLVTSRAPLRLRWEHEVPVAPLALPPIGTRHQAPGIRDAAGSVPPTTQHLTPITQYAAVALFAERARAVLPEFRVTAENAGTVAAICAGLDGLPLALELAAARVKLLSLDAICGRLTQRLALLTSGARDVPARHQTLRAALAWSYDLLDPTEQRLLRRLAVFVGGCTLAAAEAVCSGPHPPAPSPSIGRGGGIHAAAAEDPSSSIGGGVGGGGQLDILDGIASLVDKNLLWRRAGADGEPRFGMLETLHEYALEQLEASGEATALRQMHAQYYVALAEEAEPHMPSGRRAAWAARLAADYGNLRAAFLWSQTGPGEQELGLRLAGALILYWLFYGPWSDGRAWLEGALAGAAAERAPRTAAQAKALWGAALIAYGQGDLVAACAHATEGLRLARELRARRDEAWAAYVLGSTSLYQGATAGACAQLGAAVARFRNLGETWPLALSLWSLGDAVLAADRGSARALYEESLALFRGLDDAWGAAFTLTSLGRLALEEGEYAMARRHNAEGLAARRRLGTHMAMRFPIAVSLISLGEAACCAGDDDEAAALFEEALALSRELGSKPHIAWALHNLGRLALRRGDAGRAAACFGESLRLAQAAGQPQRVAAALAGMAGVLAARGEAMRAARLAGAAQAQYEALGLTLHPADRRDHAQRAAAVQQALGEEAFAAAQAAGRAMPLDEAVADALRAGEERAEPPAVGPRAATSSGAEAGLPDQLTAREAEVLALIAEGIGNQAIAARLVVSLRTVEHHIASIYRKIGARGRADAVAYALRHGLD